MLWPWQPKGSKVAMISPSRPSVRAAARRFLPVCVPCRAVCCQRHEKQKMWICLQIDGDLRATGSDGGRFWGIGIATGVRLRRFQVIPSPPSECNGPWKSLREDSAMITNKITIRDDFSAAPICPHCDKEIQEIASRRVESLPAGRCWGFPTARVSGWADAGILVARLHQHVAIAIILALAILGWDSA